MKIFTHVVLTLSMLISTSTYAASAKKCSVDEMKVLEEKEFIERFLAKYPIEVCRSVQIFEKGSKKNSCIAEIKVSESYQIIPCTSSLIPAQQDESGH